MGTLIQKKLNKSLEYIKSLTLENVIAANCYSEETCVNIVREFKLLFPLGFTLHMLASLSQEFKDDKLISLESEIVEYFKSQENTFSYNYFDKSNISEYKLPDDLDDTALIISAIFKSTKKFDEESILKIINLEIQPGGPYRTWYVSKDESEEWHDVDPIVNAHLVYYLALIGIRIDNTEKYLKEALRKDKISSPYYPSVFFFYFNLSKFLSLVDNTELKNLLLERLNNIHFRNLNVLEKILYGLCLNYLKEKLKEEDLKEILRLQNKDGSISEYAVCYDYTHNGSKSYTSNKALMTSLWIELINLELDKSNQNSENKRNLKLKKYFKISKQNIELELNSSELGKSILNKYPIHSDSKPILFPYLIAEDLNSLENHSILHIVSELAYYGWIGYTIFDSVIDSEGDLDQLSWVNYLLRLQSEKLFQLLNLHPELKAEMMNAWLTMDINYVWEIKKARIKKNPKLKKSFGYDYIEKRMIAFITALSNIPIYLHLENAEQMKHELYVLIRSLLIIDQLNDDAHDWREDLKAGILTFVTHDILLNNNIEGYEEYFWVNVIPKVEKICEEEYGRAYNIIKTSKYKYKNFSNILKRSMVPVLKASEEVGRVQKIRQFYSK